MGTLQTIGGQAAVKYRDSSNRIITTSQIMGIVNTILEELYQNLVMVESKLAYARSHLVTLPGLIEYAPGVTHRGFLDDGVWVDGSSDPLFQTSEDARAKYGVDETADSIITNGAFSDFTAADPDNWTQSGTITTAKESAAFFYGFSVKLTAGAANDYIYSVDVAVVPETTYTLYLRYKNTSGDIAQYKVYDVTNAADIEAATDLASTTEWSDEKTVEFDTPADCNKIRIYLMAKTSGDIVWFDHVSLLGTSSVGEPEAFYPTEDDKIGLLWIPSTIQKINFLYWKPYTAMSSYDDDTLPWGGIFNAYIEQAIVVNALMSIEGFYQPYAVTAQMAFDKAMQNVYSRGCRELRQQSDMFTAPGV